MLQAVATGAVVFLYRDQDRAFTAVLGAGDLLVMRVIRQRSLIAVAQAGW